MADVSLTVEVDGKQVFSHRAINAPVAADALDHALKAAMAHNETQRAPVVAAPLKKTEAP
jgi:hypothetical protein